MTTKKTKKLVGTINLNEKVILSDPCYNLGTWCTVTLENILPGEYNCYVIFRNEEDWGERISNIIVIHKDYEKESKKLERILQKGEVGVDSGQAGIYDYKYYSKYHSATEINEDWYNIVCNLTYHNTKNKNYHPYEETKLYANTLLQITKKIFEFCDKNNLDKEIILSYILKNKETTTSFIKEAVNLLSDKIDNPNFFNLVKDKSLELEENAYKEEKAYIDKLSSEQQEEISKLRTFSVNKKINAKEKYMKSNERYEELPMFDGATLDNKCLVSSSGYGDGGYKSFTKKINNKIIYIEIEYIPEGDEE